MSYEVVLAPTEQRAKVRNPWAVPCLSFVTLSIYGIVWWYKINRELRDLGRARAVTNLGDSPATSTWAYALGGFVIVPAVWTIVGTSSRVKRAQVLVGVDAPRLLNGWIVGLLWIFTFGIGAMVYTQYAINRVWQRVEGGSAATAAVTLTKPEAA